MALICVIVNNGAQNEVKTSSFIHVANAKSEAGQKAKKSKLFYPVTFGNSFIVFDDQLVCNEQVAAGCVNDDNKKGWIEIRPRF